MTKKEFLDVLIPELKRLEKVEHLRDLARNGRYDEAQDVLESVDYSSLDQYYKTVSEEFLKSFDNAVSEEEDQWLEVTDIPQEYLVTFTLYLCGSKLYHEEDVMRNWEELQDVVAKQGEDGVVIAEKMYYYYLTDFDTIAELMEPYEEEDIVD